MSAGFRAGQANDGYLQINGTDILTVSSGVLGVKNTGAQSEVRLYCESNNAHYASLKSPPHGDFIGNVTFTLPGTSGSSGQVLQTDGSGNLSWVNQSGGGGGGGVSDKMSEGNTEAEVVDTGSDGHFKVTTEGVERLRVDSDGKVGIGTGTGSISSGTLVEIRGGTGGQNTRLLFNSKPVRTTGSIGEIFFRNNDDSVAYITCGHDGANDAGSLTFGTQSTGGSLTEKLRITSTGEIVSTNGTLRRDVSTSSFTVTGDTASNTGANINLYGASHSSLANIFRVRTGATERLRVGPSGQIGLGGANYGTSGQVLTSGGASGAVSWTTISGGGGSYGNSDVDNHINSGAASSGQILSWNGSDYAWVADQGGSGGGGISDLVDDTTPQLGGNLDLNNNNITGTGTIPAANLTGTLPAISGASLTTLNASELDSGTIPDARFPATLPATSGTNLTNLPAANLTGTLPAISGANLTNLPSPGISNVVEDTTPQLGGNLDVQSREINTSTTNGNIKLTPNGTGVVEVRGAGGNDGTLQLNCSAQSHGIKLKSPPHSASASYTLTFPNSITAGKFLTSDSSGNLSFSTTLTRTSTTTYDAAATTNDSGFLLLNNGAAGHATMQFQSLSGGSAQTGQATISAFNESSGSKNTALTFGTRQNSDSTVRERLRITSAGLVGIGTDNINAPLQVNNGLFGLEFNPNSENAVVSYNRTTSAYAPVGLQGSTVELRIGGVGTALKVDSAGNVGIGETDPSYEFHVKGAGTVAYFEGTGGNSFIGLEDSDDSTIGFIGVDGGSLKFQTSGSSYSDKLVITSAGKIGVGVTPDSGWQSSTTSTVLQVKNGVLFDYGTAQFDVGHNYYYDGTNYRLSTLGYASRMTFQKSDGSIRFWTLPTGLNGSTATPSEKVRILHGGGITFNGDSAAANALDDYEEGTFTPNIDVSGTSGSLSIGYSAKIGRYVKVGRIVHFTIDIRLNSWSRGSGTGGIMVQGLPFAPVDSSNYSRANGFCNLYNWNYSSDSADIPIWSVYQDNNHPWVNINIHRKGNTNTDVSDPGSNSMLFFSGTYEAGA